MTTQDELQSILKERYGINKNISQALSAEECQRILTLLSSESSTAKLVDSFIGKNRELITNNQQYGRQRTKAENQVQLEKEKAEAIQVELQASQAASKILQSSLQTAQQTAIDLQTQLNLAESDSQRLQESIAQMEQSKGKLVDRKQDLAQETSQLEAEIETLMQRSQALENQVGKLKSEKQELVVVNDELKKDNKRLKNIVDMIRLKFSKDVNQLLKYEDSEIRKALIKMYKSTLG
jgi:chromosome segregation ATPase